jgi:hypothetical protein
MRRLCLYPSQGLNCGLQLVFDRGELVHDHPRRPASIAPQDKAGLNALELCAIVAFGQRATFPTLLQQSLELEGCTSTSSSLATSLCDFR